MRREKRRKGRGAGHGGLGRWVPGKVKNKIK
jgi:hypothetical protein